MKVNRFEAGLNTRIDPSLLQPNEAVRYVNIDNEKLTLKSAKNYTQLVPAQSARNLFYVFKGEWKSSFADRDYQEYAGALYYTEVGTTAKRDDNSGTVQNMGIARPEPYPAVDGSGDEIVDIVTNEQIQTLVVTDESAGAGEDPIDNSNNVTLQYTYTYYNSALGLESAPAPLSAEVEITAGNVAHIKNFNPVLDPQADLIRLYRLGDGVTTMTLVDEISTSGLTDQTVYVDEIASIDLPGTLLDTYSNTPPPENLRYLVEAYGIMFGAVGNKLYFSLVGQPAYWPEDQFLSIEADITGIFPIQGGILVFTRTSTHLLLGKDVSTFTLVSIETEQGCISHKSCKTVKATPIWISTDGICAWANGAVEVISKNKLGKKLFDVKNTTVYDEQYYIVTNEGTLLAADLRFDSLAFKEYNFDHPVADIGNFEGVLYASINERACTLFTGEELTLCYTSPNFTENAFSQIKLYNNIYIRYNGIFKIKLYIDNKLVQHTELDGNGIADISPPAAKQRGSSIQFEIDGIGTIYEIDYKVLGRQNGR